MNKLIATTCMAQNMDFFCQELIDYLSGRLPVALELKIDLAWQERERLLDAGEIDLAWICGLPYVWKADRTPGRIALLAAPVMADERYADRPVYYSDVVVREDSRFTRLADLKGATWAYNEPGSHSGYNVAKYALVTRGFPADFFGRVVASGAHQVSLEMIRTGQVDAAAIDSTVLAQELSDHPEIGAYMRVIDTFGPSPIPPWVISTRVPAGLAGQIQAALNDMAADPVGSAILARGKLRRFARVSDRDYDPIRRMDEVAADYRWNE